jgi:hypothetical protein
MFGGQSASLVVPCIVAGLVPPIQCGICLAQARSVPDAVSLHRPSFNHLHNCSDLHNNSVSGGLPAAWAGLRFLDYLDVSSNALNGTLPAALGSLGSLQHLDASCNALTGTLPAAWSGMAMIEVRRAQVSQAISLR